MSGVIDPNTIILTRPIQAHGRTLDELVLREPTTEEIMEEGYPYLVVQGQGGLSGIQLQPKVVGRYIVRLAGMPMSSVKQLHPNDLQKAQAVVMGFFGQGDEEEDSEQSSS